MKISVSLEPNPLGFHRKPANYQEITTIFAVPAGKTPLPVALGNACTLVPLLEFLNAGNVQGGNGVYSSRESSLFQ